MKLDPFDANIDELSRIVSAAHAVAGAASESLPFRDDYSWQSMNHVGELLCALDYLLQLAELHADKMVDDPRLRRAA